MLKGKALKAFLLVLTIIFGVSLNGFSVGPCPPPYDCPSNLSTIPGTVQIPQNWHFKWDPNNPQTIADGSSVEVYVIGGEGPYSWAVSGHAGFGLDQSTGLANELHNNGACGTATITVTDARGIVVTGQVRSTKNSSWIQVGGLPNCALPGVPDIYLPAIGDDPYSMTRTVGGKRQTESYYPIGAGRNFCEEPCNMAYYCDCDNAAYTAEGGGCTPCLTMPPVFNNATFSCRSWQAPFPLVEGIFYCADVEVTGCGERGVPTCGGPDSLVHWLCFASYLQKYEEWQCNP